MFLKIKTDPKQPAAVIWLPQGKALLSVHPSLHASLQETPTVNTEPTADELLDMYLAKTDDELRELRF